MSSREWRKLDWICTLALAFGLGTPRVAWADCPPEWLPGESVPGLDGPVYAMTTWDPDGPGPEPELLIVGGDFTVAGDVVANNVAAWNGNAWQPLGSGVGGLFVSALTVYNGELIAGGDFAAAGGVPCNRIARWNGSAWQPLGSGIDGSEPPFVPCVRALTVYNAELIVGGLFTIAGGVPCHCVARWNGCAWQPLASGLGGVDYPAVFGLTVHNGELIAGGHFTTAGGNPASRIARWNGATWQPLDSGMDSVVWAVTVYNAELIAGGYFTTAGANPANYIARWNGATWQPLSGGTSDSVKALTVYNGELIAGGEFTAAGGNPASYIARWNGATWQPLGSGIDGDFPDVWALTVYPGAPGQAGELIAGGEFTAAGGQVSPYWARWGCPYRHGDLNCDGSLDFGDINPFVLALSDPSTYAQTYPDCDILMGDMNCDGSADFGDINPFVACLSNGDCGCP